jgi:hypothetical protein
MSYLVVDLDQEKRAREKLESRERDSARLRDGQVSSADLRRENSFFSGLSLSRYQIVAIGGQSICQS